MVGSSQEFKSYFTNDQQVKISITLSDNTLLERAGLVRLIDKDRLNVELVGAGFSQEEMVEPGDVVSIASWTGSALCHCTAHITQKICGRLVFLRLFGPIIEKQLRECFRLDVSIPFDYTIPEKQNPPEILDEWSATREYILGLPEPVLQPCQEGYKLLKWSNKGVIMPHAVNLSGGGMRFKTQEYVQPETLVSVSMFLPIVPPIIHVVAEALRSNEVVLGRGKGPSYITALRFHFINDKDRERIIAFLFSEQRRLLNKFSGSRL